jgi:hypothetical protein
MSHTVRIKTEIKDKRAVRSASKRLNLREPQERPRQPHIMSIFPDQWRGGVAVNTNSGDLTYDTDFRGPAQTLDQFKQAYAIERAKQQAEAEGYTAYEETLPDGSIQLTVDTGAY